MQKHSILVVDDEKNILKVVSTALKGEGYDVDTAQSSEEAIEKFNIIRMVSKTQSNVLITGESGTGKELVARAIHYDSDRAESPFVTIDCASIPPEIMESELFGHEKGAFTGAHERKAGLLEHADSGTIFRQNSSLWPGRKERHLTR